jgi:hypothetical protein
MHEHFIGDGHKRVFDLGEVPSSICDMTARVAGFLHPTALIVGDHSLETFAAGYDVLADRVGKRIYLEHALPPGELLTVEYPFDDPDRPATQPAAPNLQAEPCNIPGWEAWDYQNWRDFAAAMRGDQPIEYAMCVWLMQQESTDLAFQTDEWLAWYHYARKHCQRFDCEQSRRR